MEWMEWGFGIVKQQQIFNTEIPEGTEDWRGGWRKATNRWPHSRSTGSVDRGLVEVRHGG